MKKLLAIAVIAPALAGFMSSCGSKEEKVACTPDDAMLSEYNKLCNIYSSLLNDGNAYNYDKLNMAVLFLDSVDRFLDRYSDYDLSSLQPVNTAKMCDKLRGYALEWVKSAQSQLIIAHDENAAIGRFQTSNLIYPIPENMDPLRQLSVTHPTAQLIIHPPYYSNGNINIRYRGAFPEASAQLPVTIYYQREGAKQQLLTQTTIDLSNCTPLRLPHSPSGATEYLVMTYNGKEFYKQPITFPDNVLYEAAGSPAAETYASADNSNQSQSQSAYAPQSGEKPHSANRVSEHHGQGACIPDNDWPTEDAGED